MLEGIAVTIRSRALLIVLLVSVVAIYTSGCIGRPESRPSLQRGTIQGQVVSTGNGMGLPGVHVAVEGTSIATFTDANGLYTLTDVPVGQHTIVFDYPQPGGEDSEQVKPFALTSGAWEQSLLTDGSLSVLPLTVNTVTAQQIVARVDVQAERINKIATVEIPVFGAVDNVFLYHATPRVGSVVATGTETSFYVDVHYALNTVDEGFVIAMLSWPTMYGEEYPHVQESLHVTKGTGSAVLQLTSQVPHHPRVGLHIALVDANGALLAMKSLDGYRVGFNQGAVVPELTVLGYADHHLLFAVSEGNPVGFDRYELHLASYDCRITPLFTSYDPDLDFIALPHPAEGARLSYELCLVTEDGTKIPGASVSYEVPHYGVKKFSVRAPVTDMVADPVRDVLYIADAYRNVVSVLSTETDRIEQTIRVGPSPRNLAISDDGTYLYVAHAEGTEVAVIDLNTREIVRWIPVLPWATSVAVHDATRRLYVGTMRTEVQAIDLDTGETLWETSFRTGLPTKRLTLSDDGTLLLASVTASGVVALSSQGEELAILEGSSQPFFVGDRILSGRRIHDANTFARLDDNPNHPFAYNAAQQRLYVFGGLTPEHPAGHARDTIYEYTFDDETGDWYPTVRVRPAVQHTSDLGALASSGQYLYLPLYFGTYSVDMVKIDLAVRRSGTPQ